MRFKIKLQKEVTMGDLQMSAYHLGMVVHSVKVLQTGQFGGMPTLYEVDLEVPEEDIVADVKEVKGRG